LSHQFGVATSVFWWGAGECHEGAGLAEAVPGLAVYGKGLLAEVDGCAVCFLGLRRSHRLSGAWPSTTRKMVAGQDRRCSAWARASSYRPAS